MIEEEDEEVIFSEKYAPFFDLLSCWDEVERLSFLNLDNVQSQTLRHLLTVKDPTYEEVLLIEQLREIGLNEKEKAELKYQLKLKAVDTVLISGGRDSGKTFALTTWNCVAVHDFGHRILFTRQTMSSTDNSITEALRNRIELLGMGSAFMYANHDFTLTDFSKGKISITGQKTSSGNQTAKLKSLEDYSIFETDEGEELTSHEDWKKIKRSLRAQDVQCLAVISFNPPTREHWIAEEFYEGVPDGFNGIIGNVMYIHTTYLDNGRENMAEHNWREYEELRMLYEEYLATAKEERPFLPSKIKKAYEKYQYDILGGFKRKAEGVIYDDVIIGKFDETLGSLHGLDFGSNDPDACVEVAVNQNEMKIYLRQKIFQNGLSTAQLASLLEQHVGYDSVIIGDAAAKKTIRDLWDLGFEIEKCRKGKVEEEIKIMRSYTLVIDPDSLDLQKAANNYRWADRKGSVPHHDWSDLLDAARYAAMYIIRGHGNLVL